MMPKAKRKKTGRTGSLGWILGAAAVGIGAGIAVERAIVGRSRFALDPYSHEPYGRIRGDRRFEVSTPDGAVLVGDEVGPRDATRGVIFLHGFCLDRTIWHHQYRGFTDNRKYVFYDARHHGEVTGGSLPTDTRVLAADLKAVLDHSGLQEVVLVGHSMGGMTVLEFCREHPEETGGRVKGLVLVNTTYTDAIKTLVAAEIISPIERRARRVIDMLLDNRRSSRLARLRTDDLSWLLVKLMGFGPKASPSQIEFVHSLLTCFPSPQLVETLRGIRAFDMEEALAKIDVPTLI
ncbi:MAG: alpha/beta fold hydrolase, partial [Acidimicrobiia bacterium]